jgi:hypothetical protein
MIQRPLLEVFTTSWNEPETVEKLIKWYRDRVPGCKITLFDNDSEFTDGCQIGGICFTNGVTMHTFSTEDKMDELTLISLRNNCWTKSAAKFIIVCDSDELVDITEQDLLDCNDGELWNLCKCNGVELFGHTGADKGVFYGVESEGYSKSVLFHRDSVVSMNFAPGSHTCNPTMQIGVQPKWNPNKVNLFHTKWQDWDYGIERQHAIREKGISADSKQKGWNFHYSLPDSAHEEYFNNGYAKRERYDTL